MGETLAENSLDRTPVAAQAEEDEESGSEASNSSRCIRVLVINEQTGEPVPNAKVYYYELWIARLRKSSEALYAFRTQQDLAERALQHGGCVVADAQGRARVPIRQIVCVYCTAEDHHGSTIVSYEFDRRDEDRTVALSRRATTEIHVIGPDGSPLPRFPLTVSPTFPGPSPAETPHSRMHWLHTGADGTAQLSQVDTWIRNANPDANGVRVTLGLPGVEDPDACTISFEDPPESPPVLKAPETGSVRIHVLDPDGKPSGLYDSSSLLVGKDPPETSEELIRRRLPSPEPLPGRRSSAYFRYVALGHALRADASTRGLYAEEVITGPQHPSQLVEVTLQAIAPTTYLAGRVVDDGGEPVACASFSITLIYPFHDGEPKQLFDFHSETAMDGRWMVEIAEDGYPGVPCEAAIQCYPDLDRTLGAPLDIRSELHVGKNDLGTIVLSEQPLIASGRAFLDGVRTRVDLEVSRSFDIPALGRPTTSWVPATVLWSDDDRFTIRGPIAQGRYSLEVSHNDAQEDKTVEFQVGSTDLELHLDASASLQATLVRRPRDLASLSFRSLIVTLAPSQNTPSLDMARIGARRHSRRRDRQDFEWHQLDGGVYDLAIWGVASATPLTTIHEILVNSGRRCSDPRLEAIEISDLAREIRVQVIDDLGNAIRSTAVLCPQDPDSAFGTLVSTGSTTIAGAPPFSFRVSAPGYSTGVVNGATEDCVVRLFRGPTTTFDLPAIDIPNGVQIAFVCESTAPNRPPHSLKAVDGNRSRPAREWFSRSTSNPMGNATSVEIPGSIGGTFQVHAEISNDENFTRVLFDGLEQPWIITDALRNVQLELSEAKLQAALREIDEDN